MNTKIKVLVTGANGFVGSHIIASFTGLDNIETIAACRDRKKLTDSFSGEIREGDLTDKHYLQTVLEDIDIVCHAAAWTALWGNTNASNEHFLTPSLNLINAAQKAGVKKFIFTSSVSVASPSHSENPLSDGIPRPFWPHLNNVIKIENHLRSVAEPNFQTTVLRLGLFVGERYGIGMLPILLPRLKTHLVPWVKGGQTHIPLIDGRDIGQAFVRAAVTEQKTNYEAFNIVGKTQPTVREVIDFIHQEFDYPKPHFSVPFSVAYAFAWLMEKLDPIVPWEPLVTRSIIHLLEETHTSNHKAKHLLNYEPIYNWQDSVRKQIKAIQTYQINPMSMAKPL